MKTNLILTFFTIFFYAVAGMAQCINTSTIVTSNYNGADISCFGASDGAANVIASGGTAPYSYAWDMGQTNSIATNLPAGKYHVTVTDASLCSVVDSVTLTQPTQVTAAIASTTNVTCNGMCTGAATVVPSGGTAAYTYQWSTGHTTATAIDLCAGVHSVSVTDANGCVATTNAVITQPSSALSAAISSTTNVTCFGGSSGFASTSASGGTGPYTFVWMNGSTAAVATGLSAGVYMVTVTDVNGCTASANTTINQPSMLIVSYGGISNVTCNGGSNGSATSIASGGTGGYTFVWSNFQTTMTATGLVAAFFTVTVADANGCTASNNVTITQPSAVTATITSTTNVTCYGAPTGSATVTGSGGSPAYTYLWGAATGNQTTPTATGLTAGVYGVTATDANGCVASTNVTITQPASAVVATISSFTNVSCNGGANGTATAVGNGGVGAVSFQWNGNTGGQTTPTATGLVAGINYCVTVTDANGCSAFTCVTITEPSLLSLNLSTPDTLCANTSTSITTLAMGGTAPYTFYWSNGNTTNTYSNITNTGSYFVTVTDANGCTTWDGKHVHQLGFAVNFNPNNILYGNSGEVIGISTPTIPYNIQTQSTHGGNTSYNWTPSTGLSCTTCPNPTALPQATTTYYLESTYSPFGCLDRDTIIVYVHKIDTAYLEVAPDSTVAHYTILPQIMTSGTSMSGANSTNLHGTATASGAFGCFEYASNGAASGSVDVVYWINCDLYYSPIALTYVPIWDTTVVFVTTASCVWPGDTDDDGIANNFDLLPIGLHHSAIGNNRNNASINYTCQPSREWGLGTAGNPTVDIKHIDCDGNGVINDLDTNAIVLNWTQTHAKSLNNAITGVEIYIDTATANPGDTISLPIILGNTGTPVAGYGVAFTIHYDVTGVDTSSVSIDFSNSWLGTAGTNLIGIYKDFYTSGQVDVAMTRIDHNNVSGGGIIGLINMTIKDDVLPKSNFVRLDFSVSNVRFIDNMGDTISTLPLPSQVLVVNTITSNNTLENNKNSIAVFPNPTSTTLTIQSLNEAIETIQLYDMTGRLVATKANTGDLQSSLNMEELPSGIYVLSVRTATTIQQVQVMKN